jgi:hypothetical protein
MPWFDVLRIGMPGALALRIFTIEFTFYGALLALCLLWRTHRR